MDYYRQIAALARSHGMVQEYRDNFGTRRRTSLAANRAFLTAVGVSWETPALLEASLRQVARPGDRLLEPLAAVLPQAGPNRVACFPRFPKGPRLTEVEITAELVSESGEQTSWGVSLRPSLPAPALGPGERVRCQLPLPRGLDFGYYDLKLKVNHAGGAEEAQTHLVVAPSRVFEPESLAAGARVWGLNVPLYAVSSARNWGMGDFSDLKTLQGWAGELGAAFVGVNPLHAPAPEPQASPSPYYPSSRQWLNFLYLDLESVPELSQAWEARNLLASPAFREALAHLRTTPLIDYPEVYLLKGRVLKILFNSFKEAHGPPEAPLTPRGRDFYDFCLENGRELDDFARYQALADFHKQSDWRGWPPEYRRPESPAVAAFAREHRDEIRFHQYAQWLAAAQLEEVRRQALQAGLAFTLYQDLALGSDPGGFDTWAQQDLFAFAMEIGAPPDAFNPRGQKWGLPPLIPERLKASGHRFFARIIRENCPPGGLLRLDHVMGLFRQFWISAGAEPREGAYVRYPARELLAILALESHRRQTLIIGEDLGTLSPAIRRNLSRWGLYSYRVFYFERDSQGGFIKPEAYPAKAVAGVTTHDLPTLAGFWQGKDVEIKRNLNLYPDPAMAEADAAAREQDRIKMVQALNQRGRLPEGFPSQPEALAPCPEELRKAVLAYLAQSRAALMEVRLEEVFSFPEQQNLPGTTDEHPNWRRKLPLTLEEMQAGPEPTRLAAKLKEARGGGPGTFL